MSRPTSTTKSQTNAWSRPLSLPRAPPGLTNNNKSTTKTSSSLSTPATTTTNGTSSSSSSSPATINALRYRFLQLQLSLIGQTVTLTLKNGSILQGILHTFTPFQKKFKNNASYKNQYVIKAVQIIQQGNNDNGSDDSKEEEDALKNIDHGSTVIIPAEKVVKLYVKSLRLEDQQRNNNASNGNGNGSKHGNAMEDHDPFRTDTDISSSGVVNKNGDLVHAGNAWTSSADTNVSGGLDDFGGLEGSGGGSNSRGGLFKSSSGSNNSSGNLNTLGPLTGNTNNWDQFSANEKKFGIKATFDEDLYTTSLDKTNIDSKQQMEALRLAREIEGTTTSNIHVAEERGQAIEGDFDEEDLYSGVLDKSGEMKERKQLVLKPRTVDPSTAADTGTAANENKDSDDTTSTSAPKPSSVTSSPVKKMNYAAAAAAKMDVSKASPKRPETKPTSASTSTVTETAATSNDADSQKVDTNNKDETKSTSNNDESSKKEESKDENNKDSEGEEKPKSKLNPKASSFVFNPTATEWKPSFGGGGASTNDPPPVQSAPPVEAPHVVTNVQMQPQYVHYQPMPPPMMPYQPYGAMPPRVPPQYGMPMPMPATPVSGVGPEGGTAPSPAPVEGPPAEGNNESEPASSNNGGGAVVGAVAPDNSVAKEDGKTNEEPKQPQQQQVPNAGNPSQVPQQQQQQQQQPVHMSYVHGGPSGYYQPGMPMPGRGPVQQYPPQMVGGPRQIPVSRLHASFYKKVGFV
jgi:PAB1-binding protein PBP1